MSTLTASTVGGVGAYTGTYSLTQQTGTTLHFSTADKYLDRDIYFYPEVTAGTITNFSGGDLTNKQATATFTNASTSQTDNSGIQLVTSGEVTRNTVNFSSTQGWQPTINTTMASSTETWSGNTYYLSGVTLTNGKTFNITIPNGSNGTLTLHFAVDSNGNTTIT